MNIFNLIKKARFIDYFFIGSFFFLIGVFIVIFSRSDQTIMVRVKVTDPNVLYSGIQPGAEYAESFVTGDIERNEVGKAIATIRSVEKIQTSPTSFVIYLDLDLKANYNPLQKRYTFKGRPIVFGQPIVFTFANTKAEAIVVDFPGYQKREKQFKKITVVTQLRFENRSFSDTYGVQKFFENAITKDQIVKDKNGNEVIKVIDVKSEPARRTVVTSDNRSVTIRDSELVDLYYTLELSVYEADGKYFMFDYVPIELGSTVPLIFKETSIWPTVVQFQK